MKNQKNGSLQKIWRCIGIKWGWKFVISLCAAVIISLYAFAGAQSSAKIYLTLNYQNASKGLYPNGTRFNMYDVISEDTLENAIQMAGLKGLITARELAQMLSVAPRFTRAATETYIDTEYAVTLDMEEPIGYISAQSLLELVGKAYSDAFAEAYVNNDELYQYAVSDMSEYDYNEITLLFDTRTSQLTDYLSRRKNESDVYRSELTGETFDSLRQRVSDFKDITCQNFYEYIVEYGLTKDYRLRLAELNYRQRLLNDEYDRAMLGYDVRVAAINEYDMSQSAAVMIPTYDTSREFYMSKTKTGMDYMADAAMTSLTTAKDVRDKILVNTHVLEHLTEAQGKTSDAYQTADAMAAAMKTDLDQLIDLIKRTDDDYVHYKLYNSLICRSAATGFADQYGVKAALAGFLAVYATLSFLQYFVLSRREEKRKLKAQAAKQ